MRSQIQSPRKVLNEEEKREFRQDQDECSVQIFTKRVEVKYDKEYSIGQLDIIKKQLETKEGTLLEQIEGKDELILKCTKIASSQEQIGSLADPDKGIFCNYKLIFKMMNSSEFDDLIQCDSIDRDNINLMDKSFILVKICDHHSEKCPASKRDFIFNRNLNFMKRNAEFLQQIINQRYKQTGKPQTPKVYSQYISKFLGYDFMYYGYESQVKPTKEENKEKASIFRFFENHILRKARQKYAIPPFQPKKIKKIQKPKYSVTAHEDQLQDQPDHQSPYQACIRKKNRPFGRTMTLRPKCSRAKKLQSQFSQ